MDKHTLKLQTNLSRLGFQPGRLDGLFGNKTLAALNHWQKQYELPTSDEVRPEDHTAVEEALAERRQNVIPLGTYQFSEVFPRAKAEYRSHLNQALTEGCMTGDRALMFLAQLGHEIAGLRYMEEIASGAAYEGRLDLGNTQVNDGTRLKGRGHSAHRARQLPAVRGPFKHSVGEYPHDCGPTQCRVSGRCDVLDRPRPQRLG